MEENKDMATRVADIFRAQPAEPTPPAPATGGGYARAVRLARGSEKEQEQSRIWASEHPADAAAGALQARDARWLVRLDGLAPLSPREATAPGRADDAVIKEMRAREAKKARDLLGLDGPV